MAWFFFLKCHYYSSCRIARVYCKYRFSWRDERNVCRRDRGWLRSMEELRIPHTPTYLHADLRLYLNSLEGSPAKPLGQLLGGHEPSQFQLALREPYSQQPRDKTVSGTTGMLSTAGMGAGSCPRGSSGIFLPRCLYIKSVWVFQTTYPWENLGGDRMCPSPPTPFSRNGTALNWAVGSWRVLGSI